MLQFLAVCVLSCQGAPPAKTGVLEQSWTWMHSAWNTVEKQGRPAAERLIRQYPDKFRLIPKRSAELYDRVTKDVAGMKLDEKKAMLQELWRIRQGLNLMALLDSGVLTQLTGIDAKVLKGAQQQVTALNAKLKK